MYSEQYPFLYKTFPFDNFEELVDTLENSFGQLFNISLIEQELSLGKDQGSYVQFFKKIVTQLKPEPTNDLYTSQQISQKIYEILHEDHTVRACFLSNLIFSPPLNGDVSLQLGFQEKVATGRLKVPEVVTYLDMLRMTHFLGTYKSVYPSSSSVAVLNLANIEQKSYAKLQKNKSALMINLNLNLKEPPKWAVIDLRGPKARIFCETPLLETERGELERRLAITLDDVSPGKADSLISTGYTAIAWLDQNITRVWNFDINADFNLLLADYALMIFRADGDGVHFGTVNNEYNTYFTDELKAINNAAYGGKVDPLPYSEKWGVFSLCRMVALATLGTIEGEHIPYNDLAKVIEVVGRHELTSDEFERYSGLAYRSRIPRFSQTLIDLGILAQREKQVTLIIPTQINFDDLSDAHIISCAKTSTNSALLYFINRDPRYINQRPSTTEEIATAMVLTMFRSCAKVPVLNINLPEKYQLNKNEQEMIVRLMQDNAYVTELNINENNQSLKKLKNELLPVFARNRWLAENDYLPPFYDNYWQRAAKYWLIHLNQHDDLLTIKHEHDVFKRCVKEMGVHGLRAVLNYLSDSELSERLLNVYGSKRPDFYMACTKEEVAQYLDLLITHLRNGSAFPFAKIGVAYEPGADLSFIRFISYLNQRDSFENIQVTDCLRNPNKFIQFMKDLSVTAQREGWTGLIIIPELEDKNNLIDEYRELHSLYRQLNNIILHNRHLKQGAQLAARIIEASPFDELLKNMPPEDNEVDDDVQVDLNTTPLFADDELGPWPIRRGGSVQLQMQQQQEIQQNRQVQQKTQHMQMHMMEQVITSELVTYDSIDKLLGQYYQRFKAENECQKKHASLWDRNNESELQGFFHTWINANPHVNAPKVIQAMTQDAAKMLLRHHSRVSSGLNLENLPKGFYLQPSKTGGLILCYDAEIGLNFVSPLTLSMNVKRPVAELWEGDFRLFNVARYLTEQKKLEKPEDFKDLLLFEILQPPRDYTEQLKSFCDEHNDIAFLIRGETDKVARHWPIFFQTWQYQGLDGVNAFLALKDKDLTISTEMICDTLFAHQSEELREWVKANDFDLNVLRAIGQAYYLNGDKPIALFLTKLRQIETELGSAFFLQFKNEVLARSENFNSYLSPDFFTAMDTLIANLAPKTAKANRVAFLKFCALHLDCVGWESVETLWNAFDYFVKNLNDMGLSLNGDEFDGLNPQNMLIGLDRLLLSLQNLPGQSTQEQFLKSLTTLDLTHGGVHYAVQHEGFKFFDPELMLHDFALGTPTYAPKLVNLYDWKEPAAHLNMQRVLASLVQFSHDDYRYLTQEFAKNRLEENKHQLIWLLFTDYGAREIEFTLDGIRALPAPLVALIGTYLHQAVFTYDRNDLDISLSALIKFKDILLQDQVINLLKFYPHGSFLEALSIFHHCQRPENQLQEVLEIFAIPREKPENCPDFLFHGAYKLATLFGASSLQLDDFIKETKNLKVAVQQEMHLLIKHLLSINYDTSALDVLMQPDNWNALIQCVKDMNQKPSQRTVLRHEFIQQLIEKGIQFKHSKAGDFRPLKKATDYPRSLTVFVDHQARMWAFLKKHIVVSTKKDAQESLKPLLAFFRRLQLNRTYLNEVEPLLAILEKTAQNHMWSAGYFVQMLDVLKPDNDQTSFPFDILQVLLNDEILGAKPLDFIEKDFPKELVAPLKNIIANTIFTRSQQAQLCRLLLKEFSLTKTNPLLIETINLLSVEHCLSSRDYALQNLLTCKTVNELSNRLEKFKKLMNHTRSIDIVNQNWDRTIEQWIKAMTIAPQVELLFSSIMNSLLDDDADKRAQIMHIIAWSSLHEGLRSKDDYLYERDQKASKLVTQLLKLSDDELTLLASCYPKQPAPGTGDLLHLLKKKHEQGLSLGDVVQDYLCNPFPEIRADYQRVAKTRQSDLQRMLAETKIIDGDHSYLLTPKQISRISVLFSQLKQLESGESFVEGSNKAVSRLTQAELAEAFHRLSKESVHRPHDEVLQAQIWALLFEALGRTSRKYPHMAQQFALITNDIVITSPTRVLQLATGEGKSHFVALRAAYHAAQGKVVDVCTAKRSLAQRDLEDYQEFYNYLNLQATHIEPKSSRETYIEHDNAQGRIHYSTLGDLSLFLDEQSYQGNPIIIDPKNRVGLGDELDFIYFDEGRKTGYNYARPTGRTPKQMIWFYQAVNSFYKDNARAFANGGVKQDDVKELVDYLYQVAEKDENKHKLINKLRCDGAQLVSWLQSAHEAHSLEKGVGFTVREENIQIGDASYLMKEIIPLSTDNQKVVGSTFSVGVHQLLAVRLNTEAKAKGESQNYHVHAESYIISSQIAAKHMSTLWGNWEGFTGTVSDTQAQTLKRTQGTQVLQVSTNQRDLRFWHQPMFFDRKEQRIDAMIKQLQLCMKNKQSILFSCKNDQQVLVIKKELSERLTDEELSSLIFYTNEDEESSAELLNRKQKQENWLGGKKQKGVGLIASGFGRGDNVGVEAVFLFDANDINDLKQKGGRTARNGEEGEVFQFYLASEMEDEFEQLRLSIRNSPGVDPAALDDTLNQVEGKTDNDKRFNQIMLLREYVFNLQNSANQGYRAAIAQFSGWGMSLVGNFIDPTQRSEFVNTTISMMRKMEKQWLLISSKEDLTPTEKIRRIEEVINLHNIDLWDDYKAAMGGNLHGASAFDLKAYPEINLKLIAQNVEPITTKNRDLALLGSLLASNPLVKSESKHFAKLHENMEALATNEEVLHVLAQDARKYKTATDLVEQVNIRVSQIEDPAKSYAKTRKKARVTPNVKTLFRDVDSNLKEEFFDAMNHLIPSVQKDIDLWLKKSGFASEPARISKILPLVRYLASFSEMEQTEWAKEYIEQFDTLWLHASEKSLAIRLSGNPMNYHDNEGLWALATSVSPDHEDALFPVLQYSVATGSFAHRVRMLTRAEGWISKLPIEERAAFLAAFAQVMGHFQEGRDWDTFTALVDKTNRWWNKKDGMYRSGLCTLWHELAKRDFSSLETAITHALHEPKADWLQLLNLTITLPDEVIVRLPDSHWIMLRKILNSKEEGIDGKRVAARYFECIGQDPKILNTLDQWINNPKRTLSIAYVMHDFDSYPLTAAQRDSLLRVADEELLDNQTFSLFCQTMASKKETITQLPDSHWEMLRKISNIDEKGIDKETVTKWYWKCTNEYPDIRDALDQWITNPKRILSIARVIHDFDSYPLTAAQRDSLLRVADEELLDNQTFSLFCQTMASKKETITQLPDSHWEMLRKISNIDEKGIDKETVTKWYWKCTNEYPDIRDALDQWITNPKRILSIARVIHDFDSYPLTAAQRDKLLCIADKCLLDDQTFSLFCHIMVNTNKIIADSTSLSQEEKTRCADEILALPVPQAVALLKGLKDYAQELKANSHVFLAVLDYAKNNALDETRIEQLITVLLHVAGKDTQTPDYLNHLIKGVDRFQSPRVKKQDIDRLLILLSGNDALPLDQVLFDNVAGYLENNVSKGQLQAARNTIDVFYSLAKKHRGDVERMFAFDENPELREMFDFGKQRTTMHRQRVIWMHLLNQDAFVTDAITNKESDSHIIEWSDAQNQDLLQRGLDLYLAETNKLLEQNPKEKVDLSREQQHALFRLADEMAIIGEPKLTSSRFHDGDKMKKELDQLSKSYGHSLFKSKGRITQFTELQEHINTELQKEDFGTDVSRYESLLVLLQQARIKAMQDDLAENQLRGTFKLNRGGHSRYFQTLNQMEDLVVRSWVRDVHSIQSFQNYTQLCQKNLLILINELSVAVDVNYQKREAESVQKGMQGKFLRLFSGHELPVLLKVRNTLERFNTQVDEGTFTAESLNEMTCSLQEDLSKLPGHLQTLVKEVLMRSETLDAYSKEGIANPGRPVFATDEKYKDDKKAP